MQNSVCEFKPFRCHLALNGALALVLGYRHHVQAMRGIARVFFVLVIHGAISWFRTIKCGNKARVNLCKIEHLLRPLGPKLPGSLRKT